MRHTHPALFLSQQEKEKIVAAIRAAEKETSGEIRVHLAAIAAGDILQQAKNIFEKIGMTATKERSGVLIFLCIESRQFAILGDTGIHAKVPENFWEEISQKMAAHFKQGHFATGMIEAILEAGEKLKTHFPHQTNDQNELSDRISYSN